MNQIHCAETQALRGPMVRSPAAIQNPKALAVSSHVARYIIRERNDEARCTMPIEMLPIISTKTQNNDLIAFRFFKYTRLEIRFDIT